MAEISQTKVCKKCGSTATVSKTVMSEGIVTEQVFCKECGKITTVSYKKEDEAWPE